MTPSPVHNPARSSPDWTPWLLYLIALFVSGAFCICFASTAYHNLDEAPKIAAHVARGDGFLNPIDPTPASPPSAWLPPLYPLLMAGVYRVFGIATVRSLNVMLGINVVCYGLLIAGASVIARELFGPRAKWVAPLLVLADPTFLLRTVYLWDTIASLAAFAWLIVAAIRMGRQTNGGLVRFTLFGAALGGLMLLNASYVFCVPPLVLLAARKRFFAPLLMPVAVSVFGFVLVLTPWTIRNYQVFHQIFFVRAGLNLELWLGNRPQSTGWFEFSQHPSKDPAEGHLMTSMGESDYYKLCGDRFRQNLGQNPRAFAIRTARRAGYILFGNPAGDAAAPNHKVGPRDLLRVAFDAAILLAGLTGAFVALRRGSPAGLWILSLGFAAVLPFVVTHVIHRYTMPLRFAFLTATAGLLLPKIAAPAKRQSFE